MRKYIAVLLALSIAIAVSACSTHSGSAPSTETPKSPEASSAPSIPSTPPASIKPSADASKQKDSGKVGDYSVTIQSIKLTNTYDGKPVALVDYMWTNNGDKATSFTFAFSDKAYQSGIECALTILMDNKDFTFDNAMKDIKPGATLEVQVPYLLNDTATPVDIEVTPLFSFGNNMPMVAKTFKLA